MALKPRYKLVFSREFDKEFAKLPRDTQLSVMKKIRGLEDDPFVGKPLRAALKGLWSLRVGKYRVIYKVLPEKEMVQLITVGHRKRVYRRVG